MTCSSLIIFNQQASEDIEGSSIVQRNLAADSPSVHPQQQQQQQEQGQAQQQQQEQRQPQQQQQQQQEEGHQQPAEGRTMEPSAEVQQQRQEEHHQRPAEQLPLEAVVDEVVRKSKPDEEEAEILQASLGRSMKRKVPGQVTESSRRLKTPTPAASSVESQQQLQASPAVQPPQQSSVAHQPTKQEPSSSIQQRYDNANPPPLPQQSPDVARSSRRASPRPSSPQPAEALTRSPPPPSSSPRSSSPQLTTKAPSSLPRPSLETTRSPVPSGQQLQSQPAADSESQQRSSSPTSGSRTQEAGRHELEPHLQQHLQQHQHRRQRAEAEVSETELGPEEPESDWGPVEEAEEEEEEEEYVNTALMASEPRGRLSPPQPGAGSSSRAVHSEPPVAASSAGHRHRQIPRPPPLSHQPPPQQQIRVQPQPQPQPQPQQATRIAQSRLPEMQQLQSLAAADAGPGLAVAGDKAELMRQLYARYATAPGQPRIVTVADFAEPRMSGSQLQRLVTALGLMQPAGPLTQEVVGSTYARCKPPGTRKLNFLNFLRALSKLHQESGGADVWGAAKLLAVKINRKHQKNHKQQPPQPPQPPQPQQQHPPQQRRVNNPPPSSSQPVPPVGPSRAANLPFGGGGPGGGGSSVAGGPQSAYREDASHLSDSEVASAPLLLPRLPAVAPNYRSLVGGGSGGGAPITAAPQVNRKYSDPVLAPVAGGGGNRGINAIHVTASFPTAAGGRVRLPTEPGISGVTAVVGGAVAAPSAREAFASPPTGRPSPPPPPLAGPGEDHSTPGNLHVAARHPGALQRSLTGIAALPQGYALLATAPPLAPTAPLPAPTTAAASTMPSTSAATVAAGETLQTLVQRVSCLEEQSQEHKSRHAELRLEMLQKLAELTATSTLAAAAAPPQPPQSAPAAQQTPDAVDAAHVAVTAAGTAHRAEVGAAAAARVANSAAATAAAAGREVEHMSDRVSACETMVRQQLEGMQEQRDAVESVRVQMAGMEGSITSIVVAAVSAQMEQKIQQQLEKELEKRLQERLDAAVKAGLASAMGRRQGGGRMDGDDDADGLGADDTAAAAPAAVDPRVKPNGANTRALVTWLDAKVSELSTAKAAHEAQIQQLQRAQD
ncbi:hypothetical protein Vretimale_14772, partial [Volvox reticuliferus]